MADWAPYVAIELNRHEGNINKMFPWILFDVLALYSRNKTRKFPNELRILVGWRSNSIAENSL